MAKAMKETVGVRVRRLREWRGLGRQELADRAGVSKEMLRAIEVGRRPNPSIQMVRKIAEALDCTVDEVLGDEA